MDLPVVLPHIRPLADQRQGGMGRLPFMRKARGVETVTPSYTDDPAERYRLALETIRGPSDSGPFIGVYRAAGGGYEGLQAIARAALDHEESKGEIQRLRDQLEQHDDERPGIIPYAESAESSEPCPECGGTGKPPPGKDRYVCWTCNGTGRRLSESGEA